MTGALSVWWDNAVVGTLAMNEHGETTFQYDGEWLADPSRPPLSMSLPKREELFKRRECRPFFGGLLPEEGQLDAIARNLGVSKANEFKLLEKLGGDVAGALTLWPAGEQPPVFDAASTPQPLDDQQLAAVLDRLPRRPLLAGEDGLRLSLAGAQAKLPVVLVENRIALPAPGQPTTHIVKPPIPQFQSTCENEALMMGLAQTLGLSVAAVELCHAAERPFLLISRYDREVDAGGAVRRLHQEDFCQALGIPTERKYQTEGGPTFANAFDLLQRAATRPAVERLKLLDAAIFNATIGNADAHGKNYSLLYRGDTVALAPLYDLVCTAAYSELSPDFAMKIAGRSTVGEIGRSRWDEFAGDIGFGARYVRERVGALAAGVQAQAQQVADALVATGGNRESLAGFVAILLGRAVRVSRALQPNP